MGFGDRPTMMFDDELHFSASRRFTELMWDDPRSIIKDYRERMMGMYIEPAKGLCLMRQPFAAGVLAVCTIDALAKIDLENINISTRGIEYAGWLERYIPWMGEIDPHNKYPREQRREQSSLAMRFYQEVRNGIVHEGRMKEGAYFSVAEHPPAPVFVKDGCMVVHSIALLENIEESLRIVLQRANQTGASREDFVIKVYKLFEDDIKSLHLVEIEKIIETYISKSIARKAESQSFSPSQPV